jgi:GT2 family glycosyltransferase/peptidoglycan/xylan/chitin deacetylase (PgdA/CDA1 family)
MRGTRLSDNPSIGLDEPSFSIVVPTYQRRDLVCETVKALSALDYAGAIEIIVVVDVSKDGTVEALSNLQSRWPLRVVETANQGAAAARNRGASEAVHDVVLFLDDDMIADTDMLNQHAGLHRDGADAVIGDTPIYPDSATGFLGDSVARWIASTRVASPLSPFDIFTGQLSVQRTVFQDLGGFDAGFTATDTFGHEDSDFGVRLLDRFDVRHNPAAISHQNYAVSPRDYMARGRKAVAADLRFARKHPQLARELFERKGISRPLTRLVYSPLTRIPLASTLITKSAVALAEFALKTPFRSSRLVARYFSGARSLAYWSALRASGWFPLSDELLVLCYHAIADQSADPVLAPYGVPPALFRSHLDALRQRGSTFVGPAQLAAYFEADAPLPRRSVLLTFDDGYADLVGVARQTLRPRDIDALAFAVTGSTSGTNEWDQAYGAQSVRLLSPEDRITLASLGVEVGSHSHSHAEMPLLDAKAKAHEASASAQALSVQGLLPRFFAYPFGALDAASMQAVRAAGYLAAFGCRPGRINRASSRFALPRVVILANDRGWRFDMKIAAPRLFAATARWTNRLRKITGRSNDAH